MGLLPDWQIKRDIKIEPFAEEAGRPGVISYGVSSYGYDVRVGRYFKVFTNVYGALIDPKNFNPSGGGAWFPAPGFRVGCHAFAVHQSQGDSANDSWAATAWHPAQLHAGNEFTGSSMLRSGSSASV